MKAILLAITVAASFLIATSLYNHSIDTPLYGEEVETAFTKWMMEHGKAYGNESDRSYRLSVFAKTMAKIQDHNNNNLEATYEMGLNKFSDLTPEEFKAQYLGSKPAAKNTKTV